VSDASNTKTLAGLKNKSWIWLVAAFGILILVGVATS
jgi:hypothetical protein